MMKKLLPIALAALFYIPAAAQPYGPGNMPAPPQAVLTPQSYGAGAVAPVPIDAQGGLVAATGLRTAAVSCSSSCTTFGSGSNGVLFTISSWPYQTVDIDITSAGSSNTVTFEQSNDNPTACASSTTWLPIYGNTSNSLGSNLTNAAGGTGHYVFTSASACFRARVSAYSSGTVTVGAYQTAGAQMAHGISVIGSGANSVPSGAGSALAVAPNPYPAGATAITASATGTTGVVTATLTAVSGKTTYICGFNIGSNATAGTSGAATIAGTVTGTLSILQGVGVSPLVVNTAQTLSPCVPASGTNTNITVNSIAASTNGVTDVSAWGYNL